MKFKSVINTCVKSSYSKQIVEGIIGAILIGFTPKITSLIEQKIYDMENDSKHRQPVGFVSAKNNHTVK